MKHHAAKPKSPKVTQPKKLVVKTQVRVGPALVADGGPGGDGGGGGSSNHNAQRARR